jgi:cytoskeleton protein RodZ
MTDEQDKSPREGDEDAAEAGTEGPRCGERLAEARHEQDISISEIAKELHLDEPNVRALERNDFDSLGAPVFAKGHLRKYAELVGVNVDDILTDYYQMTRQDNLPPVVVARRRMRREVAPGPWVAVIVVIIVVAAAYYWFAVFSAGTSAPAPVTSPVEQQQSSVTDDAESNEFEPGSALPEPGPDPIAQEPIVQEPIAEEPVADEPAPVETELLDDGEVRLTLNFSGDCWTEISDATGRRLFFEMGRAGETVELTGVAPFAVLLGDVDNVAVQVNGNNYPVTTNNPGSRTARLTISQP